MRPVKVWVIGPCHFATDSTACATNARRCEAVAERWREGDLVYVTGHVSRRPGGPTLDSITADALVALGIPPRSITTGTVNGIFPEAEHVTRDIWRLKVLGQSPSMTWVCSDWYNKAAEPVWMLEAAKYGLPIDFHSVFGTGGPKIRRFYAAYGLVIRIAMKTALTHRLLASVMTRYYRRRADRFTMNGCA